MENFNFTSKVVSLHPELLRYAYKLTENHDSANDLVQECYLKALDNQAKFVVKDNLKAWMYTIMRNIFINNYRRAAHEVTLIDPEYNMYLQNSLESTDANKFETVYDLKELYKVLHSVPEEYKKPFFMFVAGFRYREIADKMELPIGTIKSRLHFIRGKLKIELKDFHQN